MKVKVSCITNEHNREITENLRSYTENVLGEYLQDKDYGGGVTDFILCIVSLGDVNQNAEVENGYSKFGQFKDPFEGAKVKYLSLGLSFFDSELNQSDVKELKESLIEKLKLRLMMFSHRKTSGFKYEKFQQDLLDFLDQ